ncbi:chemotaxis protein CheV [Marinomonas mediterranea]|jgi:CheW protein|uniref:Response regulator receiver modulated CheW protein n=1 Tax=Marinomonas mediterranea (strain ATCC 700492 / JCM 21426 / NBRC 103028 / MMB-1) TaxID=717774 RepID=F2K449_MARM1|nr:chemotaxis protein CheV [Marinomonas mediterranea]ADZ91391.1 response regulator receiver modulated CheW protein [Marinomonas mediterranea MMB-1]WCN09364.1 response regulator [Marinomonas mediterranea]WCN13441.1 response regulator [Marinomonas mediterranea]WCN17507.1 response regulator [Marinomonas mediterranea MMB-1]
MASMLDAVDQRTQLVGENRLELLMFRLGGMQMFAINVFKVQEVVQLPRLNLMPHRHPSVAGVTHFRGRTIPVIDLSESIGMKPIDRDQPCNLIVTEYNNTVQGFMVGEVDRIINMNWNEILPPPDGTGRQHYLTAITRISERLVEIIDVEKVLAEISPYDSRISDEVIDKDLLSLAKGLEVLVVDDSMVGLSQCRSTLDYLGITVHEEMDGKKGLERLKSWASAGEDVPNKLLMMITDAEMPEMDGYRLTREIREDPRLKDLYIVLHTSLSGSFNKAMVQKVGCDDFLSKFQPDKLATVVQDRIRDVINRD